MMKDERKRVLNEKEMGIGSILYWMSRDQRAEDNWALLYAQELAKKEHRPLEVVFTLSPVFLNATFRMYDFMLRGLEETEKKLRARGIPFRILLGNPPEVLLEYATKKKVGAIITDFDPLRIKKVWKKTLASALEVPLIEVDAHNIIPVWIASPKQEYAAYTIRPKIHRLLPEYLEEFPNLSIQKDVVLPALINWKKISASLTVDRTVAPVSWCVPGSSSARKVLADFIDNKLSAYDTKRNDPNVDAQSGMSPYLHFGQIAPARVALLVGKARASTSREAYLEELIVRRELAENFCFYREDYDKTTAFPAWVKKTFDEHAKDVRTYHYAMAQFEKGKTHDELWNAAQREMVTRGKMHGYMRMYWAKKILEWTKSPAEALKVAIYLNDKYSLDGRDPNGYAGIMWSIGGVHDRAWFPRPIFGLVRFMSLGGAKGKFDVARYIASQEPSLFDSSC